MPDQYAAGRSPFEEHLTGVRPAVSWRFVLFVAGASERSVRAVTNVRGLCEDCLPGRYSLEVVDVHAHPDRATAARVLAAPTLVRELPLPRQVLVGDLSDTGRVLDVLGLSPRDRPAPSPEGSRGARR